MKNLGEISNQQNGNNSFIKLEYRQDIYKFTCFHSHLKIHFDIKFKFLNNILMPLFFAKQKYIKSKNLKVSMIVNKLQNI